LIGLLGLFRIRAGAVPRTSLKLEQHMSMMNVSEREPLAYSVDDFCKLTGLGRSTTYNLINKGELVAAKVGHRVIIPHNAAVALLEKSTAKTAA
jgi:excisionase family DNA binding protein